MTFFRPLIVLSFLAALAAPNRAAAGFATTGGLANILDPSSTPTGAKSDFFQDMGTNKVIHGWSERQNVTLDRDVFVDIAGNGTYHSNADLGGFNQLKISQGTVVSSQMLYYDPKYRNQITNVTFTFDGPILGVIVSSDRFHNGAHGHTDYFKATDFLGNPKTRYPHHHFDDRGLEWWAGDTVVVSGNSITLSLWASSPGDQIRVITAAQSNLRLTPAPPGILLSLAGVAGVGVGQFLRRRSMSRSVCRMGIPTGTPTT